MAKRLFIGLGIFLGLLVLAFFIGIYSLIAQYESSLFDQTALKEGVDRFEDAQAYVESQPDLHIFYPRWVQAYENDAGQLLNSIISWLPNDSVTVTPDPNWYQNPAETTVDPDTVSWFGQLHRFDHWNLESQGTLEEYLAVHQTPDVFDIPEPHWAQLRKLLRHRLLLGVQQQQLAKAIDEGLKLVELVATAESLLGNLVAIAMLKDIEQIGPSVQSKRSPEEWHKIKTAVWGIAGYFRIGLDQELEDKVFDQPMSVAGLCGAINERTSASYFQAHLIGPFYREQFQKLDLLYERLFPHCHARRGKAVWRNRTQLPRALQGDVFAKVRIGDSTAEHSSGAALDDNQWQLVTSFPLLHQLVGLTLATVGNPSFQLEPPSLQK